MKSDTNTNAKGTFQNPAREHKEVIQAFLKTFIHFFGPTHKRLGALSDPRRNKKPGQVDHCASSLVFTGILMLIGHLEARRQVRLPLYTLFFTESSKRLFKVNDVPHGDTMNDVFTKLPLVEVQEVVRAMTETLIDKKVLYPHRLLDHDYVLAIAATGMLTYDYPHCPYFPSKKHGNETFYYHQVLEA